MLQYYMVVQGVSEFASQKSWPGEGRGGGGGVEQIEMNKKVPYGFAEFRIIIEL